jgi:hypothetical protein
MSRWTKTRETKFRRIQFSPEPEKTPWLGGSKVTSLCGEKQRQRFQFTFGGGSYCGYGRIDRSTEIACQTHRMLKSS